MTALYSVILADGSTTELWPISGDMTSNKIFTTLFRRIFSNTASIVDDKNIITAANIDYVTDVKEQLDYLREKFSRKQKYKLVTEPVSRNSAPALSMAVKYINDMPRISNVPPVIISVPANQFIINREEFFSFLEKGVELAKDGYIVAFANSDAEINNGYSYIKVRKNPQIAEIEPTALKASAFIEQSCTKEKKASLKGKMYLNSGIYMFNSQTYFSELKKHAPELYNNIISADIKDSVPSISLQEYEKMPDVSIENALISKSKRLAVVPLNSQWKKINNWNAIYDISTKDKNGNCIIGNAQYIDLTDSIVYSTSKVISAVGIKDKVIAETQDALLISDKNNAADVKKITKKLNTKSSKINNIHETVRRPWGCYKVLEQGNGFLTKCITVNSMAKLSVQMHHHRSEHWIILEGEATVIKGKETLKLYSGESISIGVGEVHSIQNTGKELLKVMEIQQGDILDENDIVRLEDIYGRV